MANQGINNKIIKTVKQFYEDSRVYIKLDRESPTFKIHRGVKQGDPLSPNLFNALLEDVLREVDWGKFGIKIDGEKLSHLRFADNIVLISEKEEEIQKMMDEVVANVKAGLEINEVKTKYMSNKEEGKIVVGNSGREKVEDFTYLGQVLEFKNKMKKELEARRVRAWRGYWALGPIFKGKLRVQSKVRKLESCIYTILLYDAQTWSTTKTEAKKLLVTQNSMLRKVHVTGPPIRILKTKSIS